MLLLQLLVTSGQEDGGCHQLFVVLRLLQEAGRRSSATADAASSSVPGRSTPDQGRSDDDKEDNSKADKGSDDDT